MTITEFSELFHQAFGHIQTGPGLVGSLTMSFLSAGIAGWVYSRTVAGWSKAAKASTIQKIRTHFPRSRFHGEARICVSISPLQLETIKEASKEYNNLSDFVREACAFRIYQGEPLKPLTPFVKSPRPRKVAEEDFAPPAVACPTVEVSRE
jgi:hypothetical protein